MPTCSWHFFAGVSAAATLGAVPGGPVARLIVLRLRLSDALRPLHDAAFPARAAAHVGCGVACLAAVLLTVRHAEGRLWTELRALRRQPSPAAARTRKV